MPNDKPFEIDTVRYFTNLWQNEEISFSKMVEMFNDEAEKYYQPIIDNLNEQINDAHHF